MHGGRQKGDAPDLRLAWLARQGSWRDGSDVCGVAAIGPTGQVQARRQNQNKTAWHAC